MTDPRAAGARDPRLIVVDDHRRPLRPTPLLWVALAIVAVPIVVSMLQHALGGWVPEGDDAWVARRTQQVFSTDPPLIGQESTADDQPTDRGLSHPGPIAYYLLAVPYALSGWSAAGLAIGAGLVVLAAAAAAVVAAWRAAGDQGALAASLALALMAARLSQEWLVRPTSSTTVAFPLLALAFGLWAYVRGDRLGLGIAAVAGTYALQTSLVVLPITVALVVATVAVAVWRRVKRGEGALSRAGIVVAVVVAVAWVPPIIQCFASWPGNLVQLGEYLGASVGLVHRPNSTMGSLGFSAAAGTFVTYIGGVPGVDGRSLEGAAVWLVPLDQLELVRLGAAVLLLVGTVTWAWRRGSQALRSLLVVVLGAGLVSLVAFAKRPTTNLFAQTYFVVWVQAIVALVWTAILLAAIEVAISVVRRRWPAAARRRPGPWRSVPRPVALGVVALAALASLLSTVGDVNREDSDVVADISAQVRADVLPGRYAVIGEGPLAWASTAKGVGLDLIAHGYDIRFNEWGGMVDEPRRRRTDADDLLLLTTEYPDLPDSVMVARHRDPSRDVDLQVHLIPGGPYQDFCRASGEVLRLELVRRDAGDAVTVGQRRDAVQAFQAGQVRAQTPDGDLRSVIGQIEDRRAEALASLDGLAADQPVSSAEVDPAFDEAWNQAIDGFADVCQPPRSG